MDFPGSPNIERMAAENDYEGLHRCLEHNNPAVRLQAAQVLADLNDGTGWRFLTEALGSDNDRDVRIAAAMMLGELGHPRAVAPLRDALMKLRMAPANDPLAEALRNALEAIGTPEAADALRDSGYEPVLPVQHHTVIEYAEHYVRPIRPETGEIRFLSAEDHLNNAVDLRESEHTERGLVEASLALWLRPDWAYAWYLRGVLFEDLDRSFEALLAYRRAVELEPTLKEAREALEELEPEGSQSALDPDALLSDLSGRDWRSRRDAAAAFGELAHHGDPRAGAAAESLITRLQDEDREVRHAAVEALGRLGDERAVQPLLEMEESSWLVRFAILEALAGIGSVAGLSEALTREMVRIQERNPVFSTQKDPMLEVEYEALLEIGARAFERTGDIESLLELAEANAWEITGVLDEEGGEWQSVEPGLPLAGADLEEEAGLSPEDEEELEEEDYLEDEEEPEEELVDYVDETAQMAVTALQRLAMPKLTALDRDLLERLTMVPDLTLLDVTSEDEEPEPVVIVDLAGLRSAAQVELDRRGGGLNNQVI